MSDKTPYLIVGDRRESLDDASDAARILLTAARRARETGRRVAVANARGRKVALLLPDPLFRDA